MRRADPQRQRRSGALCGLRPAGRRRHDRGFSRVRWPACSPRSTGPRSIGPTSTWVVSVAADCPFLPRDLVARLHRARRETKPNLRRALGRADASGDRPVERRPARGIAPRAGDRGYAARSTAGRRATDSRPSIGRRSRWTRSSTRTRRKTWRKRRGLRSWMKLTSRRGNGPSPGARCRSDGSRDVDDAVQGRRIRHERVPHPYAFA